MSSSPVRLLVVGDAHGKWDATDVAIVQQVAPAALLVVGDLANQELAIVERLDVPGVPVHVVLGNHDAWFASRGGDLADLRRIEAALGPRNLAYSAAPIDGSDLALVGARPYSWGGRLGDHGRFYADHLQLRDESESADRIVAAAETVPDRTLVVVAHNGPTGLGSERHSIYGCDFKSAPEDWGDADLRLALDGLRDQGRDVALVVAGHMHHRLRGGGDRTRVVRERDTVHVNAAVVPRRRRLPDRRIVRHFVSIDLADGRVQRVRDVWLDPRAEVAEETELFVRA